MAKAKRPTDEQAMLIAKAGLMARDWLVLSGAPHGWPYQKN